MALLTPRSRMTMQLLKSQRNKDRRLHFARDQQCPKSFRSKMACFEFPVHAACTICRTIKLLTVLFRVESLLVVILLPKDLFLQLPSMEIMISLTECVLRPKHHT